jgi:hypothetical protein
VTDRVEDFSYCDPMMRTAMDPDGSVIPIDNLGHHVRPDDGARFPVMQRIMVPSRAVDKCRRWHAVDG